MSRSLRFTGRSPSVLPVTPRNGQGRRGIAGTSKPDWKDFCTVTRMWKTGSPCCRSSRQFCLQRLLLPQAFCRVDGQQRARALLPLSSATVSVPTTDGKRDRRSRRGCLRHTVRRLVTTIVGPWPCDWVHRELHVPKYRNPGSRVAKCSYLP